MPADLYQFLCLEDNYGVLLHSRNGDVTAAIDAPDADAVMKAIETTGWKLTHIFCTHHHVDHTAGILRLKQETGCTVYAPRREASKIPEVDVQLAGGDAIDFGGLRVEIIETPGHTLGHIVYHIPSEKLLFAADTLFPLGCGRVFEASMEEMWRSLQKLMALDPETVVYCGHEYTSNNARFALSIEPGNAALQVRADEVARLRRLGRPTVPTTIGLELVTNPFLRPGSREIRERLNMPTQTDAAVFGEIRRRKDNF